MENAQLKHTDGQIQYGSVDTLPVENKFAYYGLQGAT